MKRIDIDQPTPPMAASLGHTLLRVIVGLAVAGHGFVKLVHLRAYQGELIQLQVPNPEHVAIAVLAIELVAGLGLIVGRMTRLCAFAALCDAVAAAGVIVSQQRVLAQLPQLEAMALIAAAALFFLTAGSGRFSADVVLRERARIKAILDDDIWQRPPYVVVPSEAVEGPYGRKLS